LLRELVLDVVEVSRRRCGCWSWSWSRPLLIVGSVFLSVYYTNIDVSGERWNSLSLSVIGNNLWNSPVTGCVPVKDGLSGSVPGPSNWSWTAIAAVSGLPQVATAGWVGLPGAVHAAQ